MSSTVSVVLTIEGKVFDADRCSKAVGLTPTKVQHPRVKHASIPEQCWVIELKPAVHDSVDDAVEELLKLVVGKEDAIRSFAESSNLEVAVCVNVKIYEDRPVYELSARTIRVLSRMGAAVALDIADYSEESG